MSIIKNFKCNECGRFFPKKDKRARSITRGVNRPMLQPVNRGTRYHICAQCIATSRLRRLA
jgi:hypothetical protein